MALIGISGKSSSGKDTVGKIIQWLVMEGVREDTHPFNPNIDYSIYPRNKWEVKKFAGKLKSSIEHKFPNDFNAALWEHSTGEYRNEIIAPLQITRRDLLIKEAMDMRAIHPDYWVYALMSEYVPFDKGSFMPGDYVGLCSSCSCRLFGVAKRQKECKICHRAPYFPNWLITDLRFENELQSIVEQNGLCVRIERPGIELINSISETSLDHLVGQSRGLDDVIVNDGDIEGLIQATRHWMTTRGLL